MVEAHHTLGALRAPQRVKLYFYLKAPRSGPRRAPGGSVQKEAGDVCNATSDDLFRALTRLWLGLLKGARQFCSQAGTERLKARNATCSD